MRIVFPLRGYSFGDSKPRPEKISENLRKIFLTEPRGSLRERGRVSRLRGFTGKQEIPREGVEEKISRREKIYQTERIETGVLDHISGEAVPRQETRSLTDRRTETSEFEKYVPIAKVQQMNKHQDIKDGTLFSDKDFLPAWFPFGPIARILRESGLPDEEIYLFEGPYQEFRSQEADVPLNLPDDIRTSDEWFRLLFSSREEPTDDRSLIEYRPSLGRGFRQVNLDPVGRDFLCRIYYQQRNLELRRTGQFVPVLGQLLGEQERVGRDYSSLSDSLIHFEAVEDFLLGQDIVGEGTPERESFVLLTDPPERHLTLREIPSFLTMLRDSSNLSRYIRRVSVRLQEGDKWEELNRIRPEDFLLPDCFVPFRDRRRWFSTQDFVLRVSMIREFGLTIPDRGFILPSLRLISEAKGVPYSRLLIEPQEGLDDLRLIRRGFPDRLILKFAFEAFPDSIDIKR